MIKLINETADIHKPHTAIQKIEIVIEDEPSLTELLEAFESFLKASGFSIDGVLDIVKDEL